jgi:acetolactate synthase-1/2/3 large subunit
MQRSNEKTDPDRRNFLKGVALGGAAALGASSIALAQTQDPDAGAASPTASDAARAAGVEIAQAEAPLEPVSELVVQNPASDYMVDCLKALDIEYILVNPGGSIRGFHESIINYGGNSAPELISVMHEEVGAAFAHGYFKASGKPAACLFYGNIGLQHASMGLYNAYGDRVPVVVIAGNRVLAEEKAASPDWYHSSNNLAGILDGCIKWSDEPASAVAFGESLHRGYRIAMSQPWGPVLVTANAEILESELPDRANMQVPKYTPVRQPVADSGALAEAARMLAAAENPVIVACRCVDSQQGMDNVVRLTELLGAPVINQRDRLCIPYGHPLRVEGGPAATPFGAPTWSCFSAPTRFGPN